MKTIISTINNQIATITLNNPNKSNALDLDMREQLIQAYDEFEKNPDVRIIILNGNGKHFCAGADLNDMKAMAKAPFEKNLEDAKAFVQLFYKIYLCEKPTMGYAHGKIMGGGIGLLAACDIAISANDATFLFPEVTIGLIPAMISPFVTQRIGYQYAKYHMMTAELLDAKKALKIGLIDRIDQDALSLAESLLHHNQSAMQATKKWLNELRPITAEQVERAAVLLAEVRGTRVSV